MFADTLHCLQNNWIYLFACLFVKCDISALGCCCLLNVDIRVPNSVVASMNFALFATVMGAAYLLLDENEPQKRVSHRTVWVHEWVRKRQTEGCYAKLLNELRNDHPNLYRNFVRMTADDFDYLLQLVTPYIQKQDTHMRKAIPPGERLALTLRYLATGESFMSLQYLFRIPQPTISRIIPEVLDAIYLVLKGNYLKVIFNLDKTFATLP